MPGIMTNIEEKAKKKTDKYLPCEVARSKKPNQSLKKIKMTSSDVHEN